MLLLCAALGDASERLPNGCELPVLGPQAQVSGRGSLGQILFQACAFALSRALVAEFLAD